MRDEHDPDGAAWPDTYHPEYDGFDWVPSPEPSEEDRQWASENLNEDDDDHAQDQPPDEFYDALADEADAIDRLERGLL